MEDKEDHIVIMAVRLLLDNKVQMDQQVQLLLHQLQALEAYL